MSCKRSDQLDLRLPSSLSIGGTGMRSWKIWVHSFVQDTSSHSRLVGYAASSSDRGDTAASDLLTV